MSDEARPRAYTGVAKLLHVAAALRHAYLRDGTVSRMLPEGEGV